jgi:hypothetical protein
MKKLMLPASFLAFLSLSVCVVGAAQEELLGSSLPDKTSHQPIIPQDYNCYILRVQFPVSLKKVPTVCGYYKGYNLEFNTDFCIIQEAHPCDKFMIAITEQVQRKFDNKNLQYLERLPSTKCRLFYLTRTYDATAPWTIEEEREKNIPSKLPGSTIVLFLDPEHVDTLSCDQDNFKTTSIMKDPVVTLPYVIIKPSVSSSALEKASIATLLASVDSRNIHPTTPKEIKVERTTVVSMRTPQPLKPQNTGL